MDMWYEIGIKLTFFLTIEKCCQTKKIKQVKNLSSNRVMDY